MKNTNSEHDKLCEDVLKKIRTGEVHMKSRAFFTFKIITFVLTTIALLATSALLVSYIIFSIQASGQLFLVGFGGRGFMLFFLSFPWGLLIVDIILWICLEWLIRDFKICYQYPLSYVFLALLVASTLLGLIINTTSIHKSLMRRAEERRLPLVGSFYDHLRRPPHENGEYRGVVMSVGTSTFIIHDEYHDGRDATWTIDVPQEIKTNMFIKVGDTVFIAGTSESSTTIRAFGIRKFMPEFLNERGGF
jgi:hypothetical protein